MANENTLLDYNGLYYYTRNLILKLLELFATPNFSIGTVITGEAGTDAEATISGASGILF